MGTSRTDSGSYEAVILMYFLLYSIQFFIQIAKYILAHLQNIP